MGIIYKTTNKINKTIYIGKDFSNRKGYLGSGLLLIKAIEKYGRKNFKKEIIDFSDSKNELNEKEKFWISFYKNNNFRMYNIADGGQGGDLWTNSLNKEEISKKLSDANHKRWNKMTEIERKQIGLKISKSKQGKNIKLPARTKEHSKKLSESNKGISRNKGTNNPMYGKTKINCEKKRLAEIKHSETAKRLGFWVGDKNPSRNNTAERGK